jgi:hypothetical protein
VVSEFLEENGNRRGLVDGPSMRVGELRCRRRRRSDGVARERLVVVVVGGLSRLFARRVSSRRRRYTEAVVVDRTTPVVEQLLCDTADIECIYRMGMRWFQLLFRYVVYDTTYDDGTDFIYFVFFLSTPSLVAYIIYRPERYLPVDRPPPPPSLSVDVVFQDRSVRRYSH